jgi:phage-related protein
MAAEGLLKFFSNLVGILQDFICSVLDCLFGPVRDCANSVLSSLGNGVQWVIRDKIIYAVIYIRRTVSNRVSSVFESTSDCVGCVSETRCNVIEDSLRTCLSEINRVSDLEISECVNCILAKAIDGITGVVKSCYDGISGVVESSCNVFASLITPVVYLICCVHDTISDSVGCVSDTLPDIIEDALRTSLGKINRTLNLEIAKCVINISGSIPDGVSSFICIIFNVFAKVDVISCNVFAILIAPVVNLVCCVHDLIGESVSCVLDPISDSVSCASDTLPHIIEDALRTSLGEIEIAKVTSKVSECLSGGIEMIYNVVAKVGGISCNVFAKLIAPVVNLVSCVHDSISDSVSCVLDTIGDSVGCVSDTLPDIIEDALGLGELVALVDEMLEAHGF